MLCRPEATVRVTTYVVGSRSVAGLQTTDCQPRSIRRCTDHFGWTTRWNVRAAACARTVTVARPVRKKRMVAKSRYPSPFGLTVASSGLSRAKGWSVETERDFASGGAALAG